jgi:hypothetical protein
MDRHATKEFTGINAPVGAMKLAILKMMTDQRISSKEWATDYDNRGSQD